MSDTVIVTGAGGYLGGAVMRACARAGLRTIGLHRVLPSTIQGLREGDIVCRLEDGKSVRELFETHTPFCIVHAAAWIPSGTATGADTKRAFDDNIRATLNLAGAAADIGVKRFIHCSTVEVYGSGPSDGIAYREDDALKPEGIYGRSKLAAELAVQLLEAGATAPIILRMPGIHGLPRRGGVVFNLIHNAITNTALAIKEPESRLSLLMIDDAAAAIAAFAMSANAASPGVLNLASGTLSLRELAVKIVELARSTSRIELGDSAARNRALDCSWAQRLSFLPRPNIDASIAREIAAHRAQPR